MNVKCAVVFAFMTLMICSCATLQDAMVSPGRIQRDKLPEDLAPLYQARGLPHQSLEIIGHGAGSFRFYPMSVKGGKSVKSNKWKDCDQPVKDINTLMDMAYEKDSIISLEIDIQAPPIDNALCNGDQDCLFIMHNKVKWQKLKSDDNEAVKYMQRNTVRQTLQYFVDKDYHLRKRLYLELKYPRGCQSPDSDRSDCGDVSIRLANEIVRILETVNADTIEPENPWISVISFSALALSEVRSALPSELKNKIDYVLIAGIHPKSSWLGFKWLIGQTKGPVPMFNKEMREFVVNTPWLDRVWFSTQGIPKFEKVFSELADQRRRNCQECQPLDLSVAVYPLKSETFVKKFADTDSVFRLSLKSMMIDIDDQCE